MGLLEELSGKSDLSEITDEELEQYVMHGRLAREAEAEGARGKGRKGGGTKAKPKVTGLDSIGEIDLDDFD